MNTHRGFPFEPGGLESTKLIIESRRLGLQGAAARPEDPSAQQADVEDLRVHQWRFEGLRLGPPTRQAALRLHIPADVLPLWIGLGMHPDDAPQYLAVHVLRLASAFPVFVGWKMLGCRHEFSPVRGSPSITSTVGVPRGPIHYRQRKRLGLQ